MTIEPFGYIVYNKKYKQWIGDVSNINPKGTVELTIESEDTLELSIVQMKNLRTFALDYLNIEKQLYELAYQKYNGTLYQKTLEEIKQMYFFSALSFKEDNKTCWIVMEPDFNVESIYNHFLRFTMIDREITWMNFNTV